jgi:DNA-binding Lrp family transcriptional regulator
MTFTANCQIIRVDHQTGYNKLGNAFFRRRELSDKAIRVHGYLLSNADTWNVSYKNMSKAVSMSVGKLSKAIRELDKFGFLRYEQARREDGTFAGYRYRVAEEPIFTASDPAPEPAQPAFTFADLVLAEFPKTSGISNIKQPHNQKSKKNQDLSPTPQIWEEEEVDFWAISDPEPEACQAVGFVLVEMVDLEPVEINLGYVSPIEDLSTAPVSGEGRSSAADYKNTTVVATKVTRQERRAAQRKATWVEFGRANGLWQSMEELTGFMKALFDHAVNNPYLRFPTNWAESEIRKTCDQGTSAHWIEYQAGLAVGAVNKKAWADVYGNVNPSFRSYVEQTKFGEAGNSTARAVELAAQVLANPFKTELLWNEYQRRLERELAEMAKCERLGVTYDAPNALKPKSQVSAADTARTQQILGIDAAPQTDRPAFVESAPVPVLEAAEDESDWGEAPWDKVAADVMAKMAALGEKMGISKQLPVPEVTPLSEVYAEHSPVNQTEAQEFKVWYDSVEAEGLVDYSYSDSKHHAIVVLADGTTAMPWRQAQAKLKLER